jgi:hypothetical protein
MYRRLLSILTLSSVATLAACSSGPDASSGSTSGTGGAGSGSTASTGAGSAASPTFHKDVEPILQKSCQGCHAPGRIAPFGLLAYADVKALADTIVANTANGSMPPWGAIETDECKPRFGFRDDKRLSESELATLKAWRDGGTLEGDPKDAPPPLDLNTLAGLPGVELTVEPTKPFTASGDKDQFRCFVIDPKLTTDAFLNGSHFIAGNPKVVHHALMFLDENGESVAKADADGGYDCFGGPELSDTSLLAGWAPGGVPNELAPNIGIPIPANAKLVMQVHYHPAGGPATADATKFQMRFTKGVPEYIGLVALIGNFSTQLPNGDGLLPGPNDGKGVEFMIPAGAKGHTETMKFTIPANDDGTPLKDLKVYGASTHMHYVGTDMIVSVDRPAPTDETPAHECLVQTPKWDFNWQRHYYYDTPIASLPSLRTGDVLNFRCTYDNSLENPFVKRALSEQNLSAPRDVRLGETTLDEMCLGNLTLLIKL